MATNNIYKCNSLLDHVEIYGWIDQTVQFLCLFSVVPGAKLFVNFSVVTSPSTFYCAPALETVGRLISLKALKALPPLHRLIWLRITRQDTVKSKLAGQYMTFC